MKKKMSQETKTDIIETRMRRFVALIIDWYITNMIAVIPITFYFRKDNIFNAEMFELSQFPFQISIFLAVFGICVGILYYSIIPSFVWKGQTLGKKICKIKVVNETREDVSFLQMIKRELIGATFLEGGIVITSAYMRKIIALCQYIQVAQILQYIAYGLTLLSILYAYFQNNSQSFHDKIANTFVIKK